MPASAAASASARSASRSPCSKSVAGVCTPNQDSVWVPSGEPATTEGSVSEWQLTEPRPGSGSRPTEASAYAVSRADQVWLRRELPAKATGGRCPTSAAGAATAGGGRRPASRPDARSPPARCRRGCRRSTGATFASTKRAATVWCAVPSSGRPRRRRRRPGSRRPRTRCALGAGAAGATVEARGDRAHAADRYQRLPGAVAHQVVEEQPVRRERGVVGSRSRRRTTAALATRPRTRSSRNVRCSTWPTGLATKSLHTEGSTAASMSRSRGSGSSSVGATARASVAKRAWNSRHASYSSSLPVSSANDARVASPSGFSTSSPPALPFAEVRRVRRHRARAQLHPRSRSRATWSGSSETWWRSARTAPAGPRRAGR